MNFLTQVLHIVGSAAVAYVSAKNIRDPLTRPNTLAGFQLAESGAVPFLESLSKRAAQEGDLWLSEKLAVHANDERRHGRIFEQALRQLNKQVIDFKAASTNNSTEGSPSENRHSPFFAAYFDGYTQTELKPENIDWTVFMASTYILELDASKDFARMASVLPVDDPQAANLQKGMFAIAKDETGHAAYLYEALKRRLPTLEVDRVIGEWRSRKVQAMLAMVSNLMRQGGQMPSLARDGVPHELPAETSLVTA